MGYPFCNTLRTQLAKHIFATRTTHLPERERQQQHLTSLTAERARSALLGVQSSTTSSSSCDQESLRPPCVEEVMEDSMEAYLQVGRVRVFCEVYFTSSNVRLLTQCHSHATKTTRIYSNGYEQLLMIQRCVRVLCITKQNERMWRLFHTNYA